MLIIVDTDTGKSSPNEFIAGLNQDHSTLAVSASSESFTEQTQFADVFCMELSTGRQKSSTILASAIQTDLRTVTSHMT